MTLLRSRIQRNARVALLIRGPRDRGSRICVASLHAAPRPGHEKMYVERAIPIMFWMTAMVSRRALTPFLLDRAKGAPMALLGPRGAPSRASPTAIFRAS